MAASLAIVSLSSAANANCDAESIYIHSRSFETEGRLTVNAGKGCLFGLNGIQGAIAEARIVQAPKVGRAGVRGLTPFYVAKSGYKGQDEFSYAFIGTDQYGAPMRIVIKRKVEVVP